jgi:hypothetical protein
VLSAVTDWYKAGGNLLLGTFGNIYLKELGRVNCAPSIIGTGVAAANPDIWYASPTYGTIVGSALIVDNSTDPIYAGLTSDPIVRDNGAGYVHYPLVDAGVKEDHNCFWTLSEDPEIGDLGAGNSTFLTTFQEKWAMQALATWDHIQDYYGAAIARWNPQGAYQGTAITIGIAGWQWAQANNPYITNVQQLTKNALDELKGGATGLSNIAVGNIVSVKYYNLQGVEITAPVKGSIYIEKATYETGKSASRVKIEK